MARSRAKQGNRGHRVKVKDPVTGHNVKDTYGRIKTVAAQEPVRYSTRKRWEAEAAFWADVKERREIEARLEAEAEAMKAGILST